MTVNSAVFTLKDEEMNGLLLQLDLPVSSITVKSDNGRVMVRVRKGLAFSFFITFTSDGNHLAATIDAGALANPFVGTLLDKLMEEGAKWGLTRVNRTLVLNPEAAIENAGYQGEARVTRIAAGAGAIVIAVDGTMPLDQFLKRV